MIMELFIVPLSHEEATEKYDAEIVKILEEKGVDYRYGATGVVMTGSFDEALETAKACHEKIMSMTDRAYLKIQMDATRAGDNGLDARIAAVEALVGKKIRK